MIQKRVLCCKFFFLILLRFVTNGCLFQRFYWEGYLIVKSRYSIMHNSIVIHASTILYNWIERSDLSSHRNFTRSKEWRKKREYILSQYNVWPTTKIKMNHRARTDTTRRTNGSKSNQMKTSMLWRNRRKERTAKNLLARHNNNTCNGAFGYTIQVLYLALYYCVRCRVFMVLSKNLVVVDSNRCSFFSSLAAKYLLVHPFVFLGTRLDVDTGMNLSTGRIALLSLGSSVDECQQHFSSLGLKD